MRRAAERGGRLLLCKTLRPYLEELPLINEDKCGLPAMSKQEIKERAVEEQQVTSYDLPKMIACSVGTKRTGIEGHPPPRGVVDVHPVDLRPWASDFELELCNNIVEL